MLYYNNNYANRGRLQFVYFNCLQHFTLLTLSMQCCGHEEAQSEKRFQRVRSGSQNIYFDKLKQILNNHLVNLAVVHLSPMLETDFAIYAKGNKGRCTSKTTRGVRYTSKAPRAFLTTDKKIYV